MPRIWCGFADSVSKGGGRGVAATCVDCDCWAAAGRLCTGGWRCMKRCLRGFDGFLRERALVRSGSERHSELGTVGSKDAQSERHSSGRNHEHDRSRAESPVQFQPRARSPGFVAHQKSRAESPPQWKHMLCRSLARTFGPPFGLRLQPQGRGPYALVSARGPRWRAVVRRFTPSTIVGPGHWPENRNGIRSFNLQFSGRTNRSSCIRST